MSTDNANDNGTPFWARHDELEALVRWLFDHDRLDASNPLNTVVALLEKPWNYRGEHRAMQLERDGVGLFPEYDLGPVDEIAHDDVPLPGLGPVTLADVLHVCDHFSTGAQVFDAHGAQLLRIDRDGNFLAPSESELEDALATSLHVQHDRRAGAANAH